ncbi:hypothetical protein ACFLQL_03015 [Verrucomicrobiota bacterium]
MKRKTKKIKKIKRSRFRQDLIDITCLEDDDTLVFLEGSEFDEAIIGLCRQPGQPVRIAYDDEKIVAIFESQGMTHEEAVEFYEYNTVRALPYMGSTAPVMIQIIQH